MGVYKLSIAGVDDGLSCRLVSHETDNVSILYFESQGWILCKFEKLCTCEELKNKLGLECSLLGTYLLSLERLQSGVHILISCLYNQELGGCLIAG